MSRLLARVAGLASAALATSLTLAPAGAQQPARPADSVPVRKAVPAAGATKARRTARPATPTTAAGATTSAAAQPAAAPRPTLLVFLTVDQLRGDYLDRFGPQLTGGLARLKRGAWFANAHHDHAVTETAPGHAATLSGRFPVHTGITRNAAGVNDTTAPLVGGHQYGGRPGPGASPQRFRGTTLYDWLHAADPRTRALSISRKDRGAILPVGRSRQASVFWYGGDGRFTTSTYYADTLPTWLRAVNARDFGARYAGKRWDLLLPAAEYPEADSVAAEMGGRDVTFPHVLPADTAQAAAALPGFPFMDDVTLEAALAGLDAMRLGTGEHLDILAVSLSTTDAVGHGYGPGSRELHDQVLRLDRALGAFLDSLYRVRDSSRVLVALTADHGVAPLPTLHFPGTDPHRGTANVDPVFAAHNERLARLGATVGLDMESGMVTADTAELRQLRLRPDSVIDALAADLRAVPGVLRVDRPAGLAAAAAGPDTLAAKVARRWQHMVPPDLPVVAMVTLQPYHYWRGVTYATHGSPHDYDSHVPVIFVGAPFRPGTYREFARVVDMAPTLAAVLGVAPQEPLDGVVLRQALRAAAPAAAEAAARGAHR